MLIGSKYSDSKMYRGIRFYDTLPLLSEDIHESSDTISMKNAYIMNNIIGHGALNSPSLTITPTGLRLNEPSVLLLDGDVSLVHSDEGTDIVSLSDISTVAYESGVVCILGWYQHITAQSTMRSYGGVNNSIIENDLVDPKFKVQISTRYQFRWLPVLVSKVEIDEDSITFSIADRDSDGNTIGSGSTVTSNKKLDNIFLAEAPASMKSYAVSDLYIVPLIDYTYDTVKGQIKDAVSRLPAKPKGTSGFIDSEVTPIGEYPAGTTWYNPITREFKTYVPGKGFLSSSSTMGFLQYQSVSVIGQDINTPQDIVVLVDINEMKEGDILQVSYEGLVLVEGEHYTVDYQSRSITLLGFTAEDGDRVGFVLTKIVEANDITNITAEFTTHMSSTASSRVKAHVRLSDEADPTLDQGSGVATTPKALYDATLVKDTSNNKNYKFGVADGLLYLEEV